jgi:LysR family transcriptional activator of nhaA
VFKAGDELLSTLKGRPVASRQVLRVGALTTLSRNFQLEFLRPLVGRSDVELIVRSGNMRDLLAQLEAHTVDVVLANSTAPQDARSSLRNHLLNEQPVSLVGRPRTDKRKFRFPDDLRTEPLLLPSLDSDIRVAFDRVLELAGVRPVILAEVDDMAMLRLLAREREGVALVPPIVVRDELEAGILVEHCRIPEVTERFYAIVTKRRFPNQLLQEVLDVAKAAMT